MPRSRLVVQLDHPPRIAQHRVAGVGQRQPAPGSSRTAACRPAPRACGSARSPPTTSARRGRPPSQNCRDPLRRRGCAAPPRRSWAGASASDPPSSRGMSCPDISTILFYRTIHQKLSDFQDECRSPDCGCQFPPGLPSWIPRASLPLAARVTARRGSSLARAGGRRRRGMSFRPRRPAFRPRPCGCARPITRQRRSASCSARSASSRCQSCRGMAADRFGDRRVLLAGRRDGRDVRADGVRSSRAHGVPPLMRVVAAMCCVGLLGGSVNGSSGRGDALVRRA